MAVPPVVPSKVFLGVNGHQITRPEGPATLPFLPLFLRLGSSFGASPGLLLRLSCLVSLGVPGLHPLVVGLPECSLRTGPGGRVQCP